RREMRELLMQIADRTFLVTGGSSGLGAACARRLAAEGGRVLIADLQGELGARVAAELGAAAQFVETDVIDEASVLHAVHSACRLGRFAGVVHCAGIVAGSRVLGRDGPHRLDLFAKVVQVNLIGTFNVVRLSAAALAEQEGDEEGERGVIVTTSSVSAYEGQIGQAAYAASKAGVAGMTLPLARELASFGIRVVAIAPGVFDTPLMASLPEKVRESLARQVPFPPRFGRPEEFAALAQHAIENRMFNGSVIRLDGAIRMGEK
ncbi:MAG TPA: SDR family NAD(P)-dependent oxidoreductase, partial [Thermomicrobiales bacterium]|nr:SDR family NAD(P)-dependent oxidoreductase [Thermomicrobiales bacterium]